MRFLAAFLLLAAAAGPAAAQPPAGAAEQILASMRRDFPLDHQALAAQLAGKAPEEARRAFYAGIERFGRDHLDAILAAPPAMLIALEARQGALLRALEKQDMQLCARVGDRGFFSADALAGVPPPGLDDYGAALIEAAKAGAGRAAAAPPPQLTSEDFLAWLAEVEKIEPDVPVRAMLGDPQLRAGSSPAHLCRGAAAMHEAVGMLPAGPGARVSRLLLRSVLGAARP